MFARTALRTTTATAAAGATTRRQAANAFARTSARRGYASEAVSPLKREREREKEQMWCDIHDRRGLFRRRNGGKESGRQREKKRGGGEHENEEKNAVGARVAREFPLGLGRTGRCVRVWRGRGTPPRADPGGRVGVLGLAMVVPKKGGGARDDAHTFFFLSVNFPTNPCASRGHIRLAFPSSPPPPFFLSFCPSNLESGGPPTCR